MTTQKCLECDDICTIVDESAASVVLRDEIGNPIIVSQLMAIKKEAIGSLNDAADKMIELCYKSDDHTENIILDIINSIWFISSFLEKRIQIREK